VTAQPRRTGDRLCCAVGATLGEEALPLSHGETRATSDRLLPSLLSRSRLVAPLSRTSMASPEYTYAR
jgi:hypothetical protein